MVSHRAQAQAHAHQRSHDPSPAPLPVRTLLQSYTTSHPLRSPSPLPPSSRVDPKLRQRLPPPTSSSPLLWTLPTWIAFLQFALAKGFFIWLSLVKHFCFGPKRKSWGYRMTFITSFMRNVADHTSFADIVLIRRLISIHHLIPLPADAVVTPITFNVPRCREPRGFLKDLELAETGTRELSGEWVVGTDVWKRLKAERRARQDAERRRRRAHDIPNGSGSEGNTPGVHSHPASVFVNGHNPSPARNTTPTSANGQDKYHPMGFEDNLRPHARSSTPTPITDSDEGTVSPHGERVIYYVHGGAYYVGNAATHRLITIGVSKACNARVFAITYRLAPEHVFPLPLHDVLHGYLRLLAPPLSIAPENIVIAGDSAGGGLSLALCMYLRDEGYKMPAGIVLMSPWVDLTMSCGSWDECAESDVVPRPEADDHLNPVACYLGPKGIATYLTHPYASPLFGDLSNLPPMLIQSGDSEVLRDEITLLAHKATLSGVHVTHELYEDMVHVFQMFTWLPSAKAAISSVGRWVRQTLPRIEAEMRQQRSSNEREGAVRMGADVDNDLSEGLEALNEVTNDSSTLVTQFGEEVDAVPMGQTQILPEEVDAVTDRARQTPSKPGSSALFVELNHAPQVDVDSLPDPDDDGGSGTPTPTASRPPSPPVRSYSYTHTHADDPFAVSTPTSTSSSTAASPLSVSLPRLRRAQTSLPSHAQSPSDSPPYVTVRHRRPTATSIHILPNVSYGVSVPRPQLTSYHSGSGGGVGAASNPASPTPSVRRRLRAPTMSSSHQTPPTTRARSHSHSDMINLVEGYVEGGAANETVVYAAGGEIKSVGVLGDDDE